MIKTKMQLAHEMALAIQGTKLLYDMELVSDMAWKYADAMQAEADKRNKAIEREGQHFDDVEEWQPDWSQAPEWAKYWAVRDGSKMALWCINKPTVTDDCFLSHGCCSPAPSFGFTGSRIVERPQ